MDGGAVNENCTESVQTLRQILLALLTKEVYYWLKGACWLGCADFYDKTKVWWMQDKKILALKGL